MRRTTVAPPATLNAERGEELARDHRKRSRIRWESFAAIAIGLLLLLTLRLMSLGPVERSAAAMSTARAEQSLGQLDRTEAALRRAAEALGLELTVDSAGTGDWHVGKPPDERAIEVASRNGIDISGLRARQVTAADFYRFDHVVALDLAGHGESEAPPDGRYTLERGKEDIVRVLDALDIPRAVLVGHSFGGGVLALLASERPERAAGLFLLDPIGDGVSVRAEVEEWVASLSRADARQGLREHWTAILEGALAETRARVLADLEATPT
ncbi:MAG: alpha/beta fold hydrolase, partial [Gemmatimonadetes bacterium]|nr:alpha/beta fold hydrolase [Gemmatimonadota bacterium]